MAEHVDIRKFATFQISQSFLTSYLCGQWLFVAMLVINVPGRIEHPAPKENIFGISKAMLDSARASKYFEDIKSHTGQCSRDVETYSGKLYTFSNRSLENV